MIAFEGFDDGENGVFVPQGVALPGQFGDFVEVFIFIEGENLGLGLVQDFGTEAGAGFLFFNEFRAVEKAAGDAGGNHAEGLNELVVEAFFLFVFEDFEQFAHPASSVDFDILNPALMIEADVVDFGFFGVASEEVVDFSDVFSWEIADAEDFEFWGCWAKASTVTPTGLVRLIMVALGACSSMVFARSKMQGRVRMALAKAPCAEGFVPSMLNFGGRVFVADAGACAADADVVEDIFGVFNGGCGVAEGGDGDRIAASSDEAFAKVADDIELGAIGGEEDDFPYFEVV